MKMNTKAFVLGIAAAIPAAATVATPAQSSAAWRRMNAVDSCQAGYSFSPNLVGAAAGIKGNGAITASSQAYCSLGNDSWFPHYTINAVNVHARRNATHEPSWWMGARGCVVSFNADTVVCGQAAQPASTAIGEQTMSLRTNELSVIRNTSYWTWAPYVQVNFRNSDVVRFIYSSDV